MSKEEITKLVLWKQLNQQQHLSLLLILFQTFCCNLSNANDLEQHSGNRVDKLARSNEK